MKIKRVKIEIKGLNEALKEAGVVFERLSKGEHIQKRRQSISAT